MPTTFRIMFWNIQNVYEYKLLSLDEEELNFGIKGDESGPPAKKRRKEQTDRFNKKIVGGTTTAFVPMVAALKPDVIVIAELAVGKTDLLGSEVVFSQLSFDSFVTNTFMTALNDSLLTNPTRKFRRWASATSMVNSTGIDFTASGTKVTAIAGKNSMYEQYGVVYRTDRLATQSSRFLIAQAAKSGALLAFPERAPGYVEFYSSGGPPRYAPVPDAKPLFGVLMIHSVYGGSSAAAMQLRRDTVTLLSQLKSVEDAIKNGLPLAICGDFNLDYGTEAASYVPLTGLRPADLGMQVAIGDQKTTRVYQQAADLKNAYDQIFLSGFSSFDQSQSGAYNFVEELLFDDYNYGRYVSDHLPVVTTATIP